MDCNIRIVLKMPSICWENHSIHIASLVRELYKNTEFTDCILDTEGGLIYGHKAILAVCSPYLKKLFFDHRGMKVIPCKDVDYFNMKLILDFIYFGEIDAYVSLDVASLKEAANLLQIPALSSASQNFLVKKFASEAHVEESRRDSRDVSVQQNSNLQHESEIIDRQLVDDSQMKEIHFSKGLYDDLNEDKTQSTRIPNSCDKMNEVMSKEGDNLQEELIPITFVAVKSEQVDSESEELDDERHMLCDPDSLLQSPPCNDDDVGLERESQATMEVKEEMEDSEGDFYDSEGTTDGSKDIEMKFESVCDFSESHVLKEKPLYIGVDSGDIEGDMKQSFLKEEAANDPRERKPESHVVNAGAGGLKWEAARDGTKTTDVPFVGVYGNTNAAISATCASSQPPKSPVAGQHNAVVYSGGDQLLLEGAAGSETNFHHRVDYGHPSSREKTFRCSFCEASFALRGSLKRHLQTHSGEQQLQCRVCQKSFADKSSLHKHARTHTDEKPFACPECDASFALQKYLKAHIKIHSYDKPYLCTKCPLSFAQKSILERHMLTHMGWKPFPCSFCGATFRDKNNLKTHVRTHTGEKPFSCSFCSASFSQNCSLKKHLRSHTGEKPFTCDICGKSFVNKGSLTSHMELHAGVKHQCRHCEASFRQMNNLITHTRLRHSEKTFPCTLCGESFPQKEDLQGHSRIHTGEKAPSCAACGKTFNTERALKKHMRNHSDEKPFACGTCGAAFRYNSHLTVHARTHTGEKPFACSTCGAAFRQSGDLKCHMRSHTGETPFACHLCPSSFRYASSLKKHVVTHADKTTA